MNGVTDSIGVNEGICTEGTMMTPPSLGEKTSAAEIDNRVSTLFQLSVPFHSKNAIDILNEYDLYTQAPFQEMIQEQESKNLPSFLALTQDSMGTIESVSGTAFIRNYFKYNRKASPITQREIKEAHIYQIDLLKDQVFNYLGNLSTLRENKDHLIKLINACDPHLDPFFRGQERYYMGYAFETGKKNSSTGEWLVKLDLKKSLFWYNKSKEDRYFGAPLALAAWYVQGNAEVVQSNDLYFQNLTLAAEWIPKNHPHISRIHQALSEFRKNSMQ